jgi:hypothetical protein
MSFLLRRPVAAHKPTYTLEEQQPIPESDITPAVPAYVIRKLLYFTAALIVVPIITYFATKNTLFSGNATPAASLGAVMANAVLFTYVAVVIRDDLKEQEEEDKVKKKGKYAEKPGEPESKKDK